MWEFFKSDKAPAPLSEEDLQWMDEAFSWLIAEFGIAEIVQRKQLRPVPEDFPFAFDNSETDAENMLEFLARRMDIDPGSIRLVFHDNAQRTYSGGKEGTLFSANSKKNTAAGLFSEHEEAGVFYISIELSLLEAPANLAAVMTHELSHVKLLGENRIEENNEFLTDLTAVIFGMGIFNGNASFQYQSNSSAWSYQRIGYLPEQAWGYALALFATLKGEGPEPEWTKYLNINLYKDFRRSMAYIQENNIRPWDDTKQTSN